MPDFRIGETDFLLDGQPFRILSGALHYFRVHPDYWADRIHKAKLMGLNTIETYVAWNEHSPTRGTFDTSDGLDLGRFLDLVAAEGMYAIVRPGPFICAEWDNGGFPGWLFSDPAVGVRRDEPLYMTAVAEYFAELLPIVASRQIDRGGPVILMQIENEYGAYGDDKSYLKKLIELTRAGGITVPFTTIDQPTDQMLADGSLPELHKTGSFGSRAAERLATLRSHQKTGPLMCAEFWDGWFDHWGAHHHVTDAQESARELDALLAAGASVNIYMFHGGTNFGFTNGANDKGVFQPTVTSYDYDAPLTESGAPGEKFWAFREVISRYAPVPDEVPTQPAAAVELEVVLDERVSLWDAAARLGEAATVDALPSMDELAQFRGFALYTAEIGPAPDTAADTADTAADTAADAAAVGRVLTVGEVRDRAQVFIDRAPVGVLQRDHHDVSLGLPAAASARCSLAILVEDQGRVNYGPRIGEHKGLIGGVTLDGEQITGWGVLELDFEAVLSGAAGLYTRAGGGSAVSGPSFVRGTFAAPAGRDLFLSTEGWGKGQAFLNGFNLGRYWSRGPATTLFVPGPLVREGQNELVLFELHGAARSVVHFVARPQLGHTDF
ncbi:beta-galactosidase family protein [Agreia sp. COWG]|uniref:glycoside hydrolase family 35 protein n=1 Tax=Agreia sp. COWG TaxID=2773266 RepID=UPI0019259C22|nr:beta-galactosidase family protein [Agreia sp. COWG]CAD6007356.1 Beta-galactosidase [Agreia sp. COWG]